MVFKRIDGSDGTAILKHSGDYPFELEIDIDGKNYSYISSFDLFDGLGNLRKKLDIDGIRLMCNGAALNVYPSAMQRDMAQGEVCYWHEIGICNPKTINIFESNVNIIYASIDEQKEYRDRWMKSIAIEPY